MKLKIMTIAIYVGMLLGLTALAYYAVNLTAGDSVVKFDYFSGYPGVVFNVQASEKVCVKAISDKGTFDVTTPSGDLKPTDNIAGVYLAQDCFAPGVWTVVDGPVTIQPVSPKDLTVLIRAPLRAKIILGGLFYGLCAAGWVVGLSAIRHEFKRKGSNG